MIRIGNYSELQAQIRAFQARLSPERLSVAIREARLETAQKGMEWIRTYPPETAANRPKPYPGRWYVRGYGPMWAHKGGGASGRQTSEKLGTKWDIQDQGAVGSQVRNVASYAAFVHSEARQASFHRARGWRTDRGLIDWLKSSGTALAIMKKAVEKMLEGPA